jgi:two-component system OmpR family sensor kinase
MHEHLTQWWNAVSLRTKITGVTVMLLTLGLLVAGLGTMSVLRNYLVSEVDSKITLNAAGLVGTVSIDGDGCDIAKVYADYFLAVVSSDGVLMCSNTETNAGSPDLSDLTIAQVAAHDHAFTVYNEDHTSQWRVIAVAQQNATNEQATVVVGLNLDDTNSLIANYAATFMFFGLTVVVLGGALTRLLVTSTFGPLREVEDTAARFAAGDFSQRLGGATPNTEVGRLNSSLNTMLSRIDSAFTDRSKTIAQMRRFVGDASHELRTPLVSVRGYAELYRMGALQKPEDVAQAMERIEKEAIRMGELVSDLLELARIDEAKPLNLAPVDLVPLARDAALDAMASAPGRPVSVVVLETPPEPKTAVADAPAAAPQTGRTRTPARTPNPRTPAPRALPATNATGPISFANATLARLRSRRPRPVVPEPAQVLDWQPLVATRAVVLAEENKIRQVVTNLMGNALRFTENTSPIEIEVGVDRDRDSATIAVIDHGEGIPPQIRDKIFQRFWRADSSRNRDTGGSGLGLAIVASIVASHKGTVEVVETPGGGSTFRVFLPLLHEEPADATVPTTPIQP